jgi:hypothetical protein
MVDRTAHNVPLAKRIVHLMMASHAEKRLTG